MKRKRKKEQKSIRERLSLLAVLLVFVSLAFWICFGVQAETKGWAIFFSLLFYVAKTFFETSYQREFLHIVRHGQKLPGKIASSHCPVWDGRIPNFSCDTEVFLTFQVDGEEKTMRAFGGYSEDKKRYIPGTEVEVRYDKKYPKSPILYEEGCEKEHIRKTIWSHIKTLAIVLVVDIWVMIDLFHTIVAANA